MPGEVHLFGVRHHGPGSARSVISALSHLKPDILLVEGPADAEPLMGLLGDKQMVPPVALLIYVEADPHRAVYYPFASFSPEYQAICFALERQLPVRLMDLPASLAFPLRADSNLTSPTTALDPLSELAHAAGYEDAERWWDAMVEQRQDSADLFTALREAMTALREQIPTDDTFEALREAYMRRTIARAKQDGFERIAVVCGAWHTPALYQADYSEQDEAALAGPDHLDVSMTWVPWTYSRLSRESGYGAGVQAPGWYEFLWTHQDPKTIAVGWLSRVAQHLRQHRLDASTAQVIDAVHLVETVSRMRGRVFPDLHDLNEAALSVLCHGNELPMQIIHRDLITGQAMGHVPNSTPIVPLERDFNAQVEHFELVLKEDPTDYFLDLRDDQARALSAFLNRLSLLEMPWGTCERASPFDEDWELCWDPAFRIILIEKSAWGNSIFEAASGFALHSSQNAHDLPELTSLLQQVLRAELPELVSSLMQSLENSAAATGDILLLMAALPPLANILVYGDTRHIPAETLRRVVEGLTARIMIGLPMECISLDDDAAEKMLLAVADCDHALRLISDTTLLDNWRTTLAGMVDQSNVHPLLRGRFCRILIDAKVNTIQETVRMMRLALARVVAPEAGASWLSGFLHDGGLILIHHDELLHALDSWVISLSTDEFDRVLPLVRRITAEFEQPETDEIGRRITGKARQQAARQTRQMDAERAKRVDDTLSELLGISPTEPDDV